MDKSLKLITGQEYLVKKPFTDYDGLVHGVGEIWTYQGTNFLPYDDGLTLHVLMDNKAVVYRTSMAQRRSSRNHREFQRLC